jgi:hypothetical protein
VKDFYSRSAHIYTIVLILSFIFVAPAVFAQDRMKPVTGKFSLMPKIGTDFTVGGSFVKASKISETLTLGSSSITADISSDSQDFDDVYHNPISTGLCLNYGLTDFSEVFINLGYLKAESKEFDGATIDVSGAFGSLTVSASELITAEFDDYHETSLNMGVRHFFNRFGSLSPFVSLEGGVKHTEKIELELSIANESISEITFYDESWTPNFGTGVGVLLEIKDNISFMVETGLHYNSELNEDDTDWRGGNDYEDVNDGGERWSVPLMFSLRISL